MTEKPIVRQFYVKAVTWLLLLRGIRALMSAGVLFLALRQDANRFVEWAPIIAYLTSVVGLMYAVATLLVMRQKRIGVVLGGIFVLVELALIAFGLLSSRTAYTLIDVGTTLVLLYCIYVVLTREQERSLLR